MFLLLMTSPLNLNCLKFNNQSSLFLSLFLTYHLLISTIKPKSYLYISLNSSSFSSKKKHINFPPNKLLMFLLLMTSPLNLNCLKFNNQSSLSLLILWFVLDFFFFLWFCNTVFFFHFSIFSLFLYIHVYNFSIHNCILTIKIVCV